MTSGALRRDGYIFFGIDRLDRDEPSILRNHFQINRLHDARFDMDRRGLVEELAPEFGVALHGIGGQRKGKYAIVSRAYRRHRQSARDPDPRRQTGQTQAEPVLIVRRPASTHTEWV